MPADFVSDAYPTPPSPSESPPLAVLVHPERLEGADWPFPATRRLGALPLLERLLLTLHRAGFRRFLLVGYPRTPAVERRLERAPRLAGRVERWPEGDGGPLSERLARLAGESGGPFLLISGNQVFSPSVIESLAQQSQTRATQAPAVLRLAPGPGNEPAILALVRKPAATRPQESVEGWLRELDRVGAVEAVPPPTDGYWQALATSAEWAEAERKINRSLFKPTDNFLARLNRRISIPISRRLVPLGVGPNTVTLAVLLMSIASGVAFARGHYGWMVLGGFLAWFASVLDGTDGEVARLTYAESDFGCWLEMVCDHLFYLIVYAGIAFGLYRVSHDFIYLYTGALFEFGAILSFWVLAHQRKNTTRPGAASSFAVKWRRQLEANHHNFFYRFALRYGELTRRSTLPYAIFLFALLGDMNFVLFMSAFGANLVWILSIYSNRVLHASPAADESLLPDHPHLLGR